ncbi:diguanylate cyclase [Ilumatobacter sp.]|uniref:GGDEF domain-containing protein n=1 Tax=Ilumatobacter sp. TaxID=1967498 RepID=UPI003B51C813
MSMVSTGRDHDHVLRWRVGRDPRPDENDDARRPAPPDPVTRSESAPGWWRPARSVADADPDEDRDDGRVVERDALERELVAQRRSLFQQNGWNHVIGLVAASVVFVVVQVDVLGSATTWTWFALMTAAHLAVVAATSGLVSFGHLDDGLPVATHVAHAAVGVGWGAVLWMDLDATRLPEYRWSSIAIMVAVTCGATAGMASVNVIGRNVVIAMWVGGATALLATGSSVIAAGVVAFVLVVLSEMRDGRDLWSEMVSLRMAARDAARAHRFEAEHDALTGVLNRTGLASRISEMDGRDGYGAVYIDLDEFKAVNDRWGHRCGDLVLVEIARRLTGSVRSTGGGVVARVGGDEFVVIVPAGDLDRTVASVQRALGEPIDGAAPESLGVTASVGAGRHEGSIDVELHELIDRADRDQYDAKRRRPANGGERRDDRPR